MLLSAVLSRLKIELYTNDEYLHIHLKVCVMSYETFLNVTYFLYKTLDYKQSTQTTTTILMQFITHTRGWK